MNYLAGSKKMREIKEGEKLKLENWANLEIKNKLQRVQFKVKQKFIDPTQIY